MKPFTVEYPVKPYPHRYEAKEFFDLNEAIGFYNLKVKQIHRCKHPEKVNLMIELTRDGELLRRTQFTIL